MDTFALERLDFDTVLMDHPSAALHVADFINSGKRLPQAAPLSSRHAVRDRTHTLVCASLSVSPDRHSGRSARLLELQPLK